MVHNGPPGTYKTQDFEAKPSDIENSLCVWNRAFCLDRTTTSWRGIFVRRKKSMTPADLKIRILEDLRCQPKTYKGKALLNTKQVHPLDPDLLGCQPWDPKPLSFSLSLSLSLSFFALILDAKNTKDGFNREGC